MSRHVHGRPHRTCQHPDCDVARKKYAKRWKYDVAQGKYRLVSAEAARMHVATLMGAGWSKRAIAGAAGVSATTVSRFTTDEEKLIARKVEEKILAVRVEQVPSVASKQTTEPFVSKVGAVRRLRALQCMGWTGPYLREHYGIPIAALYQQGYWITRSTHDKVDQAFRDLAMKQGPSAKTRTRAFKAGYAPPLAWDDIDHDLEPSFTAEVPEELELDETAIQRRMHGDKSVRLTIPETKELVRRWKAAGRVVKDLERLTGINATRYNDKEREAS